MKYLIFFLLAEVIICYGQTRYDLNYLSVDNGLSQNVITVIKQDKKGFLWIGTSDGLNRFDGQSCLIYQHDPEDSTSISGNHIQNIFEDKNEFLWISNLYRGINRFDKRSSSFKQYLTAKLGDSITHISNTKDIVQDSNGDLWGIAANHFLSFNSKQDEFLVIPLPQELRLNDENIHKLFFNDDSTLTLFYNQFGFVKYNYIKKEFTQTFTNPLFNNSLTQFINRYSPDEYLFCVGSKIYKYNLKDSAVEFIADAGFFITAFSISDSNGIWLGSFNLSIKKLIKIKGKFRTQNYSQEFRTISEISTTRCFEFSRDGILWIGTNGLGVSRIIQSTQKFGLLQSSQNLVRTISNSSIRSILPIDEKTILIGGYSGLEKFDFSINRNSTLVDRESTPTAFVPYSMVHDLNDKNIVWIGSEGDGLIKFSLKTKKYQQLSLSKKFGANLILSIYNLNESILLVGTLAGVFAFDKTKNSAIQFGDFDQQQYDVTINSIMKDDYGRLWFGTENNGILLFDTSGNFIKKIDLSGNGIYEARNNVNFIVNIKDTFFAATNFGLVKMNRVGEQIKSYTTKHGLPNNHLYSVLKDGTGALWISCNNGISKFDRDDETFKNFSQIDGLQSREFNKNSFNSLGDSIFFFGGIKGLNYFNSKSVDYSKLVYPTYIEKISSTKKNIFTSLHGLTNDRFEFDYSDKEITVHFSSPIFINPNETQYYYKLEGFNKEWNISKLNSISFQNLEPGDYTFRIIRSSSKNIDEKLQTTFFITVIPPFYLSAWFKIFVVMFFAFVGPSIYYYRTRQLIAKNKISHRFSQQLLKIQEEDHKRISYALHDSLGQQLTLIKMQLRRMLENSTDKNNYDAKLNLMELVNSTINELRDISRNLHPHLLEKIGLTKSIDAMLAALSEIVSFELNYKLDKIDEHFTNEESINFYRLVQETVNNVVKHSRASKCFVTIINQPTEIIYKIEDNGSGFDYESSRSAGRGIGLRTMEERANLIGGNLEIFSSKGTGTIIIIRKLKGILNERTK